MRPVTQLVPPCAPLLAPFCLPARAAALPQPHLLPQSGPARGGRIVPAGLPVAHRLPARLVAHSGGRPAGVVAHPARQRANAEIRPARLPHRPVRADTASFAWRWRARQTGIAAPCGRGCLFARAACSCEIPWLARLHRAGDRRCSAPHRAAAGRARHAPRPTSVAASAARVGGLPGVRRMQPPQPGRGLLAGSGWRLGHRFRWRLCLPYSPCAG